MTANSLTIYDEKGNYYVITEDLIQDSIFIVYMEGSRKALMRLWLENKHRLKGKRVFFTTKGKVNYFKNNCYEVEEGLYEYIGRY